MVSSLYKRLAGSSLQRAALAAGHGRIPGPMGVFHVNDSECAVPSHTAELASFRRVSVTGFCQT